MIKYDKLIRDKIPEIIAESGRTCDVEVLPEDKYLEYLNQKLMEEVQEYEESFNIEELADLEEVLRAILAAKGVAYEELESIRKQKVEKRGAFEKRLLLKSVE